VRAARLSIRGISDEKEKKRKGPLGKGRPGDLRKEGTRRLGDDRVIIFPERLASERGIKADKRLRGAFWNLPDWAGEKRNDAPDRAEKKCPNASLWRGIHSNSQGEKFKENSLVRQGTNVGLTRGSRPHREGSLSPRTKREICGEEASRTIGGRGEGLGRASPESSTKIRY